MPAQFRVLVTVRPKYASSRKRARTACCVGRGTRPADRWRIADRTRRSGPGSRLQIRRPSSVVSPGADLRAAGHQSRPFNAGRLGWVMPPGTCVHCTNAYSQGLKPPEGRGCLPTKRRRRCWIPDAATAQKPGQFWAYAADDIGHGAEPSRPELLYVLRIRPHVGTSDEPSPRASWESCRSTAMLATVSSPGAMTSGLPSGWSHVRRGFYELATPRAEMRRQPAKRFS